MRIGDEHPDTLIAYPDAWFLSGCSHGVIHRAAIHYRLYPQATV